MALKYRNAVTGRVVTMLEPTEVINDAEKQAAEVARGGTKQARVQGELIADRAQQQAVHTRHTLAKMDESDKWERVKESAPKTQASKTESVSKSTSKSSEKAAAKDDVTDGGTSDTG